MGALSRLRAPTRRLLIRAMGEPATYWRGATSLASDCTVIFDRLCERQTTGADGLPIVSYAPMAWVDLVALGFRPSGEGTADRVHVDGDWYTVREVIEDTIRGIGLVLSADGQGLEGE